MYSKGTKKGRGVQEKEERVSITIYLDKKVWNEFQKFIAPSGISGGKIWGQKIWGQIFTVSQRGLNGVRPIRAVAQTKRNPVITSKIISL